MVDVEGRENESVDGRDNPGKDESRTFTGCDAILMVLAFFPSVCYCSLMSRSEKQGS